MKLTDEEERALTSDGPAKEISAWAIVFVIVIGVLCWVTIWHIATFVWGIFF